ncbi:Uncharacterized protein TCM_001819 [Theobroma cacao]|uniref:Reverse transcriptase domain-containing protein n=1 Tax=Theobroma cacao TaxID=3641 RepID=A0A061DJR9_THECC|nr:Uncharacterized protein TCM_001819 [Theobroma cacao]
MCQTRLDTKHVKTKSKTYLTRVFSCRVNVLYSKLLSLAFIYDTLVEVRILYKIANLLTRSWQCNSTKLLWNGSHSTPFNPSRGVKQGDSLSPYLFVLCIERFTHRINAVVANSIWKSMKLSPRCPLLTHLFFANDFILFAKASIEHMEVIKEVIDDYCACSGQKVSVEKSLFYCSKSASKGSINNLKLERLCRNFLWGSDENHRKGLSSSGQYTIATVYNYLRNISSSTAVELSGIWQDAWKWQEPQRLRTFLVQCLHGRILTNRERQRRRLTSDSVCLHCKMEDETVIHVLRDCMVATSLWVRLVPQQERYKKGTLNLELNYGEFIKGYVLHGTWVSKRLIYKLIACLLDEPLPQLELTHIIKRLMSFQNKHL